jgi:hypothetical protein
MVIAFDNCEFTSTVIIGVRLSLKFVISYICKNKEKFDLTNSCFNDLFSFESMMNDESRTEDEFDLEKKVRTLFAYKDYKLCLVVTNDGNDLIIGKEITESCNNKDDPQQVIIKQEHYDNVSNDISELFGCPLVAKFYYNYDMTDDE